ncbi:AsnC family transcriptional regulator [Clostridioides difficile]|nr:AsnC family transcriptional regulator [Clostridioides difficile]
MDEIDLKIINSLKKNSRASTSEISRQINLSVPAVSERIRKIEQSNLIQKYTIQINREKQNISFWLLYLSILIYLKV